MQNSFEKAFNEIVNTTLNEIFSETATKLIYHHLETNYKLKSDDIATNINTFKEGLEKFLSSGALPIEDLIAKHLYQRFKLKLECKEGYTFTDYVKELKQQIKST